MPEMAKNPKILGSCRQPLGAQKKMYTHIYNSKIYNRARWADARQGLMCWKVTWLPNWNSCQYRRSPVRFYAKLSSQNRRIGPRIWALIEKLIAGHAILWAEIYQYLAVCIYVGFCFSPGTRFNNEQCPSNKRTATKITCPKNTHSSWISLRQSHLTCIW